jgi:hypothetical protein
MREVSQGRLLLCALDGLCSTPVPERGSASWQTVQISMAYPSRSAT